MPTWRGKSAARPRARRGRGLGIGVQMIVVVDYGAGNLRSVEKALLSLGHAVQVTQDATVVQHAESLILPGVGAAADTMRALNGLGLTDAVRDYVRAGRPFLGV